MTHPRFPLLALVLLGSLLLAGCGGSDKEKVEGGGSGADTSPPLTQATPGGGFYSEGQLVTLTADEPATVYYTTDGVIPTVGGLTTFSAPSPVANIDTSTGGAPFVLRFFSVDDGGATESPKQAVYTYDLTPPVVAINTVFNATYGFLDTIQFKFTTDEPGFYWFELGGNGTQGSGTIISQGVPLVGPFNPIDIPVWSLEMNNPSPGILAYLHVRNAAGGTTSLEFRIKTKDEINFPIPGNTAGLELTNDGAQGFFLRPDEGQVWKLDTDPGSGSYHAALIPIDVGLNLRAMKITADSTKVYVTSSAGVYEVDVATDSLSAAYGLPGGLGCSGIALLAATGEALLTADDGSLHLMNLGNGNTSPLGFTIPLMETAELYQSANEHQTAIVWSGAMDYGVLLLDTNSASGGYLNTRTLVIVGDLPNPVPQFAFDSLGITGYTGNDMGHLTSVLLNTAPPTIGNVNPTVSANGLRLNPSGEVLLMSANANSGLFIADPVSVQATHLYSTGGVGAAPTSRDVRFSPDMTRIYLVRNNGTPTAEVLVIPL